MAAMMAAMLDPDRAPFSEYRPSAAEVLLPPIAVAAMPPHVCADLSNDYLNHYSEVLMLTEMAADDPAIAADLAAWTPLTYRAYFEVSPLRRAPAALAAYDALPEARRQAFEDLTLAMNTLARVAILALQPPCDRTDAAIIVETTGPALRRLVDRAARFLNSGGRDLSCVGEVDEAQTAIDRLIERAGLLDA
jgi:hypothetical protein